MTEPNITPLNPVLRPPHSQEAEQSLLGAMMLSESAFDKTAGRLSETDFYRETHRLIFRALAEMRAKGEATDAVTVAEWFQANKLLDRVDNGAYLTMLANDTPGVTGAQSYARIVLQKAKARRLIELGTEIADRALNGADPEEVERMAESALTEWSAGNVTAVRTINQVSASLVNQMQARLDSTNRIETGLVDVDAMLQGLLPSELCILAGRPGMGKTAAAMTILRNVTRDHYALMFSAEMSGEQLVSRWASAKGVESWKMRDPSKMRDEDWRALMATIKELKSQKLLIDDTAGISVQDIAARARQAKRDYGLRLIVVDYMQLLTAKSDNRFDEVSRISRALKNLAKTINVPVIALSQLSRKCEERADKRPHMADLRETGQIEQDADQIVFLYRHGVYDERDKSGITEWIQAKHRSAPAPQTAYTLFSGPRQEFVNADRDTIEDYQNSQLPESSGKQSRWARAQAGGAA